MKMTTIDPSKKDENGKHLLLGKEQNKHSVTLPPKKVFASKLAAAAAAAAAAAKKTTSTSTTTGTATTVTTTTTTTTTTTNGAVKPMKSSTSNDTVPIKRKLSSSFDSNHTEKKVSKDKPVAAKPVKSITHAERIVRACINQYRPYFLKEDSTQSEENFSIVLEYPGSVESESFLLLKPVIKNTTGRSYEEEEEDQDEYNPITDLMRTCELIYECYLLPEEQEVLGNQTYGIMRNLTKHRNRRNGPGFAQAVKDFNRALRQFKAEGVLCRNAKEMGHPNYDLACHILYQVYSRTVARQADALNNYQAFSNNVYGEINPVLIKDFITKTGLNSQSVFMDMGCGIGNVVLQVAAQTGCEAYGIEIMETPCKFAKRQLKEYAARMKAWRLPTGKIHFRHGDFLDVAANDLHPTLKRSDVLLVNNYAFDAATNQALAQLFLDLKDGTRIISLKSFVPKHHKINQRTLNMPESILRVEEFEYFSEAVSWTNNGGLYYISTVDRSRLKPFFDEMYGKYS